MKISVITPTFNSEKVIARAIQSVLDQDYDNYEHIVIDGLSQDKTVDIVSGYQDITYVSEKDDGQSDAMNKGFSMSTGDIIVYLNSDDYFLPGAFREVISSFDEDTDMVVGNLEVITPGRTFIQKPSVEYSEMLRHWRPNAFPHNPVQYFYRKSVQEEVGFNESNHIAMDHEFLLDIARQYKLKKIEQVLGVYSAGGDSKTYQLQKDPLSYWTYDNFSYVDRHLKNMPLEYVIDFKNEQSEFFIKRITMHYNALLKKQVLNVAPRKPGVRSRIMGKSSSLKNRIFPKVK